MMTLKQSVTFVERGNKYDGPELTVFGKDGNVHIECRVEEEDSFTSTVYRLTPADARTLSSVLLDIAVGEEEEGTNIFDTDFKANANV